MLKRYPFVCSLIALLLAVMGCAGAFKFQFLFSKSVYVPLHTAMHVFSLVVSWLVFAIGWNTHDRERAGSVTLLACGFLGVALLDFGHALSYAGMPDLVTPAGPEKAINFSLVSRLLAALALLTIAASPERALRAQSMRYAYLTVMLVFTAAVYWVVLFYPDILPATYLAGSGLTPFKISVEYLLVALHAAAAVGFYLQIKRGQSVNAVYLLAASIAMALSQALNALYADPYDIYNFLSHVYRVIGYMLIYRGVFISELREPYRVAERLHSELRESATRLRELAARMQQDIEQERKRISQSLHDEMGQCLTALQLDAGWIGRQSNDDAAILRVVERMQQSIEDSASSMRRIVADMRPRVLDDLGIIPAIEMLVREVSMRTGVDIIFAPKGNLDDLQDDTKTALYRMLQECLTNVTRHAEATRVDVMLIAESDGIEMTVADNGRGFAAEAPRKRGSFGLFGLTERAAQLGGTALVESAPDAGTSVKVKLPRRGAARADE